MQEKIQESHFFNDKIYIHNKFYNDRPIVIMNMSELLDYKKKYKQIYINRIVTIFNEALELAHSYKLNTFSVMILCGKDTNTKFVKNKINIGFVLTLTKLLKKLYTDVLHKCLIINMSKHHRFLYNMVKPFIHKVTRDKIVFKEQELF